MNKRRWKNLQPTSLRNAMEACKDYAKECQNLSVERIADRMGLADHFTLYKWISTARMPAVMIPAYEAACGCNYVTRWLASSAGKLLIDIPTGRRCAAEDTQELQAVLHSTTGALMAFYAGTSDAQSTLGALQTGLESLAWHRGNVQQHAHPQLELGDIGDE